MTTLPPTNAGDDVANTVRARYGETARRVLDALDATDDARAACCGPAASCCGAVAPSGAADPITSNLYLTGETDELPEAAVLASLGCGNPTALAELHPGDIVLDLGSGGGIDVLLSARRVGPTGMAYGLDMTDEMLALARRNAAEAHVTNVEFLHGRIEDIPLPSESVDVIISNCVINLSGDKRRVLEEAFRVLKPGGRFAVSDVVVRGALPPDITRSMTLWVGCVAGALSDDVFRSLLRDAGFENPGVEFTRTYDVEDARAFLAGTGLDADRIAPQVAGRIGAAFVRATKPAARFRPARDEDLPAIERLLTAADLPLAGVPESLPGFVVAERAGAIVGVAGLERHGVDALLRSVAVDAGSRRHGVGRSLVARVAADAESNGVRRLYLLTTTAQSYFEALGFAAVAREAAPDAVRNSVEFRSACPASATLMMRRAGAV